MRKLFLLLFALFAGAAVAGVIASRAPNRPAAPAAPVKAGPRAVALFAGGCFWSVESAFEHMPGVISATSGYVGGRVANPGYQRVVAGGTGHLEAVRVVYDPTRISYAALVARFFRNIDPLDAGGQFCDHGEQYRTAIFVAGAAERRTAEAAKAQVARRLRAPVATTIRAAAPFYPAEDYHQDYARRNPVQYGLYRRGCGRDARLQQVWSRAG
ncbi:MAG: peptide-methionine (S)-S-oxide reductase MsrA [Allosphingosinicella sp.]